MGPGAQSITESERVEFPSVGARSRRPASRRAPRSVGSAPHVAALRELGSLEAELERGFRDWCAEAAARVLTELWEADVVQLCGTRWRPKVGARVARAGACSSEIRLAGSRVSVRRPRVRSRDGREVELPTYRFVSAGDPLERSALERIAWAVSTGQEPPASDRSERRFLAAMSRTLRRSLAEPRWEYSPVLLVGGLAFREQWLLLALGLAPDGRRRLLGLRAGSPESGPAGDALLREVRERSLPPHPPELVVVGEGAALRGSAQRAFGRGTRICRCPTSVRRRVLGLLPPEAQPEALSALRRAYGLEREAQARRALLELARSWSRAYPAAAAALRDGLDGSLAIHRLLDQASRPRAVRPAEARPPLAP
jgi:hypothetical protein